MHIHLVKIGNSRGVRLPRAVIEEAGLEDVVELTVRKGVVTLATVRATRAGWADAARACHEAGDDGLVLGGFGNDFDAEW